MAPTKLRNRGAIVGDVANIDWRGALNDDELAELAKIETAVKALDEQRRALADQRRRLYARGFKRDRERKRERVG